VHRDEVHSVPKRHSMTWPKISQEYDWNNAGYG
jgi:hypothetical protein